MLPSGQQVMFTSWAGDICQTIPGHQGPADRPSGRLRKLLLPTRWATSNSCLLSDSHAPAKNEGCHTPRSPQPARKGFPRRAGLWWHFASHSLQPLSPPRLPRPRAAGGGRQRSRGRSARLQAQGTGLHLHVREGPNTTATTAPRPTPEPSDNPTAPHQATPAAQAALRRSRERAPGGASFLSAVSLSPPPD